MRVLPSAQTPDFSGEARRLGVFGIRFLLEIQIDFGGSIAIQDNDFVVFHAIALSISKCDQIGILMVVRSASAIRCYVHPNSEVNQMLKKRPTSLMKQVSRNV